MLITTRLSFLQQIQKSATNGYHFYVTGTVQPESLVRLMDKFQKLYQINMTRQQAYRERQKGFASAKFFCYADETDPAGVKIFWVLLLTEGIHPAKESENIKDLKLKKERFVYSDYQLIQKPRADGKQKFTFSVNPQSLEYYTQKIRKTVRNKNRYEIKKLIEHINKMPGFSGIRVQRKKLNKIYKGELGRVFENKTNIELPQMTNFYHRHVKVDWIKNIQFFVKQLQENNRTIKQQLKIYRNNKNKRSVKKIETEQSIKVVHTPKPNNLFIRLIKNNQVINKER